RLQRRLEPARIEIVVLDRITGTHEMRMLEPGDGAHQLALHVERQAGRDPVGVDLMRLQPLGLEENLVRSLARETVDLVLDRGAIARTHALDHAREHRRAVETRADDVVGALVRSEEHTSELQSQSNLVCRLLLENKKSG